MIDKANDRVHEQSEQNAHQRQQQTRRIEVFVHGCQIDLFGVQRLFVRKNDHKSGCEERSESTRVVRQQVRTWPDAEISFFFVNQLHKSVIRASRLIVLAKRVALHGNQTQSVLQVKCVDFNLKCNKLNKQTRTAMDNSLK